jgi:hypothetical protein
VVVYRVDTPSPVSGDIVLVMSEFVRAVQDDGGALWGEAKLVRVRGH